MRVSDQHGNSKLIVRGRTSASYHNDVLQMLKTEVRGLDLHGLQLEPVGGGRIEHDSTSAHVFGYSVAFGPAVHEVSAAIIHSAHPEYSRAAVTCAYEGY